MAKKQMKILKDNKCAIKLQKLARFILAKKKYLAQKEYHKKIRLIQKFWKNRFRTVVYSLKKLQKFFKTIRVKIFTFLFYFISNRIIENSRKN